MAFTTYGTNLSDTLSTDTPASVDDNVYGYGGNDIINGGSGTNFYYGGYGVDTVNFNTTSQWAGPVLSVVANLSTGKAVAKYAAGAGMNSNDTLDSIENLKGTNGNDSLTGDTNANKLEGLGGDDVLKGLAGDDNLQGGSGDDTLTGGTGDDNLNGGAGNDTYLWKDGDGTDVFDDSGASTSEQDVIVVSGSGVFNGLSATFNATNSIEEITGASDINGTAAKVNWNFSKTDLNGATITLGDFAGNKVVGSVNDDTMNGGALKDTLNGGNGDDNLYGNAGNDVLSGGNGSDDLLGGLGNDIMDGGTGNDWLNGSAGKDSYKGGTGSDVFEILEGEASSDTAQADIILDFQGVGSSLGDQDQIWFNTSDGTGNLWVAQNIAPNQAILGFNDSSGSATYVNLTLIGGNIADFLLNTSGEYMFV
jgi:Ca2+-binding RTX toxin-like protein